MLRHALERGLSGLIARWMLQGKAEAVFASIARAGALPPEEIDRLREETLAHLREVEEDGAPYAEPILAAARDLLPGLAALATQARTAATSAALRAAAEAVASARTGASPPRSAPGAPPGAADRTEGGAASKPRHRPEGVREDPAREDPAREDPAREEPAPRTESP